MASEPKTNKPSTSSTAETQTTLNEVFDLEFSCLEGTYYHNTRRAFLNNVHRATMFVVIIMGTSAASTLGIDNSVWFSLAAVFFATFELVFNPSSKTRDHDLLYQRFTILLGEIRSTDQTTANINNWQKEIHQIWAAEPPVYEALQMISHNKICYMLNKQDDMKPVNGWQRFWKNIFSFPNIGVGDVKIK